MTDESRNIWIVVADGGSARILLNSHRDAGVSELPLASRHSPHLASHKTEMMAGMHHAMPMKSDTENRKEDKFIDILAGTLQTGIARNECHGIILVAPAPVIGHLRKTLNASTHKHILAEVVHDYTHQDNRFIYEHVKDHIPL